MTEWVLQHLHQRKLILLGVSWGTVLGTIMVKRRPDLFWAYVGSGQFVNGAPSQAAGYELALEHLQERGDATTLQAIGSPPILRDEDLSGEATGYREGRQGDHRRTPLSEYALPGTLFT